MPLDVVLTMGVLAFLGIIVGCFLDGGEKRKQQRALEADNRVHEHSGIAWKELHERRQAVSPKRKKHGNAA